MNKVVTYRMNAAPIREAINSRPLTDFIKLEPSKGGLYICPLCGSGTGAHRTGALSIRKTDNRVTCFAGRCFGDKGQDTLGALRRIYNGKSEAEIFSLCGYQMDGSEPQQSNEQRTNKGEPGKTQEQKPEQIPNFKAEIERFAEAIKGSEGESYLLGRGLTQETIQRFRLGYDATRHCVTIPYNPQGSYYDRRSTRPDAARAHENLKGVKMPLFNSAALYAVETCFIVESPLCAISIIQEGGAAVAISGTSGVSRLIDQLKKKPTSAALILCLDNDEAGRTAAEKLGESLEAMSVYCVNGTAAIMGDEQNKESQLFRKDPNEVLQKDGREALRQAVDETAKETIRQRNMNAQEAEEERQQQTGANMIDSFLEAIQTRQYEPIPTGIRDIDNAIGGGFLRQQLVLLGAAPGTGKTAFSQWVFEGMAKKGITSLYLNLEMSREQILARSFSRIAARNGHTIRTTDILQGYKWTEDQKAAIYEAAEEYKKDVAPRMMYNPDGVTANLDTILSHIEAEAQRAEKAGLPAPCVILDYLQIVSGDPREDAATLIKRSVSSLKDYAVRHNTVIFVIIAHNRASNSTGNVSMESGRDTSALEYSADLQLALTFTKSLDREGQTAIKPEKLTDADRKYITLKIVKGRFGGVGREVDLFFNGETMSFSQLAMDFMEVNEKSPFDDRPKKNRF